MPQRLDDQLPPPVTADGPDLLRVLGFLLIPIALLTAGLAFWAVTFDARPRATGIETAVRATEPVEPGAPDQVAIQGARRMSAEPTPVTDQDMMSMVSSRSPVLIADSGRDRTYSEYTVKAGETLAEIADQHGVSVDSIVASNADIRHQDMLLAGASILVPALDGVLYGVSDGDTLASIADLHGSTVGSIVAFPGNEISDPDQLPVGLLLLVPGGRAPRTSTVVPARDAGPSLAPNVPMIASIPGVASAIWLWPVDGRRITSSFSSSHPLGIDVGVPMRSRIYAANAGRVVFAGGDPCCSYGYYIDVDHGDGYRTRYAHVDEFLVRVGTTVAAGQLIAFSGNNGRSTGPHIHFEVRYQGVPTNPLAYFGKERGAVSAALVSALPGGVRTAASAAPKTKNTSGRGGPTGGDISWQSTATNLTEEDKARLAEERRQRSEARAERRAAEEAQRIAEREQREVLREAERLVRAAERERLAEERRLRDEARAAERLAAREAEGAVRAEERRVRDEARTAERLAAREAAARSVEERRLRDEVRAAERAAAREAAAATRTEERRLRDEARAAEKAAAREAAAAKRTEERGLRDEARAAEKAAAREAAAKRAEERRLRDEARAAERVAAREAAALKRAEERRLRDEAREARRTPDRRSRGEAPRVEPTATPAAEAPVVETPAAEAPVAETPAPAEDADPPAEATPVTDAA